MPDQAKEHVALFIDWDNLAISTAADLGGASPDVKRIVQTAQQFGVILVARAYAEWSATSERLGVYRAGIETVYAPTFRYETDPVTQTSRGKSLADPCMVADCVDILHLLPSISTFVIVSGDKDLIPVVRLAQLRGKRVVVIGPDYAAGVLREIADEFISYRKVVEAGNGRPVVADTAEMLHAARRRQSSRAGVAQSVEQGGSSPLRQSRVSHGSTVSSRPRAQETRHPVVHAEPGNGGPVHDIAAGESAPKPEAQPEPAERGMPDLQAVFSTVSEILRQRTNDGKLRTRATNLKDALMAKLPGFSERRYGFSKFKDFLTAMEKSGELNISSAGPVHWVSLPSVEAGESEENAAQPSVQAEAARPLENQSAPTVDVQQAEMVRFLADLKSRSRWLTYTYVLTNLITHLSKVRPGVSAEAAAKSVMNQLVQDGVLVVDREPQEVEVGGIKHRVRMCHLQESHPLVSQLMAKGEAGESTAEAENASPASAAEPGADLASTEAQDAPAARFEEPRIPREVGEPEAQESAGSTERRDEALPEAAGIVSELQQAILESRSLSGFAPSRPAEVTSLPADPRLRPTSGKSLEDAFAALRQVVVSSTGPKRPRVGIAGLKAKLNGTLGHFDEQEFGFSRFKDFLAAAEKAGHVSIERAGSATWVSGAPTKLELPASEAAEGQRHDEAQPDNGRPVRRRRGGRNKSPAETAV